MPASSVSVVPTTDKICKPFLLDVMVFSPEAGYKFKVVVERSCTPEADPIWKLVFDLYKVIEEQEVQVVHVSFTTGTPVQQKAVQLMASEGVKPAQATVLVDEVHPAAKAIEGKKKPTRKDKQQLHSAMSKVVSVDLS
jgi:hypothetical protein